MAGVGFGFTWGFVLSHFGNKCSALMGLSFLPAGGAVNIVQQKIPEDYGLSQSTQARDGGSVLFIGNCH